MFFLPAHAQKNVLFVSSSTTDDLRLRDLLLTISDINIIEMSPDNFQALTLPEHYTSYDAVFFTEAYQSSMITSFKTAGFPVPAICFEAAALRPVVWDLITQTTGIDWNITDPSYEEAGYMIIEKNQHPVFTGLNYHLKDTIRWTAGINEGISAEEAHAVGYDLSKCPIEAVKNNATLLARNLQLVNEKKVSDFLWAIEENDHTKRMFTWHIHVVFQQKATPDFYSISKNALLWILKISDLISDIKINGVSLPGFSKMQSIYHYEICSYRDTSYVLDVQAITADTNTIVVIDSASHAFDTVFISAISGDKTSQQRITIIFDSIACTGGDTICPGDTVELNGVPEGGQSKYSYSWTSYPSGFTSTSDTIVVQPTTSTTYTVTATHLDQDLSISKNIYVLVKPSPPKPRINLKGEKILICLDSGLFRYNWYFENSQYSEHKQFLEIDPSLRGNYYVETGFENQCRTKSDPFDPIKQPTDGSFNNGKIVISPVPNKGNFSIDITHEKPGTVNIYLSDLSGRIVSQYYFYKKDPRLIQEINVGQIPEGLYLLNIFFNNTTYNHVIIIH